jgi:hypothetical protein
MPRALLITCVTLALATSVHAFVPMGTGMAVRAIPHLAKDATRRRPVAIAPKMNLGQGLLVPAAMHLADAATSQSDQITAGFICIALFGVFAAAAAQSKGGASFDAKAPVITIFEHRGCNRGVENTEYTGDASGGMDDEMCVKMEMKPLAVSAAAADTFLAETISFQGKGIDGDYTSRLRFRNLAPMLTIMDHRDCLRSVENTEYTGKKAGGIEDEMCVKLEMAPPGVNEATAASMLSEMISFTAKAKDGVYIGTGLGANVPGRWTVDVAPYITIFEHRGCSRKGKEYKGKRAQDIEDEMLVKLHMAKPSVVESERQAEMLLAEMISFKGKGIDGDFIGAV